MAYDLKHRTTKTVVKGSHFPLGATLTPGGGNFAIYFEARHRGLSPSFSTSRTASPPISSSYETATDSSGMGGSKG
jgi:hypothetical protein